MDGEEVVFTEEGDWTNNLKGIPICDNRIGCLRCRRENNLLKLRSRNLVARGLEESSIVDAKVNKENKIEKEWKGVN